MIVAECCETVSHHELQTARTEQERNILQEELWRQHMDFREVHQQNLVEMKEWQKFQSSTFDTLTRQKFIEDQNTIMEVSGRLQEVQNEVCMNDSKDFQDAESVRTGISHVVNQDYSLNILFLKDCWGLHSHRRTAKKGCQTIGIHLVFRETFLHLKNWTLLGRKPLKNRFTCLQRRRMRDQNEMKIWDASLDCQPKIQSSSLEETIQRIFRQTNNDCRFQIFILINSPRQQPPLAGRQDSKTEGMFLFTISWGSNAVDHRSGDGWFSGWSKIFVINKRYSNAKFWSTRCEDCFSTEQNHP